MVKRRFISCVAMTTVGTLSETHRVHARLQLGSLDTKVGAHTNGACDTGSHLLRNAPFSGFSILLHTSLVARAIETVILAQGARAGCARAGAGARAGARAGAGVGGAGVRGAGVRGAGVRSGTGAGSARLGGRSSRLGGSWSADLRSGSSLRSIGTTGRSRTTTETKAETERGTDNGAGLGAGGRTRAGTGARGRADATALTTRETGGTRASTLALLHELAGLAEVRNVITGFGKANVDALWRIAAVDVGDEHARVVGGALLLLGTLGGRTALDGDRCTVHVHLTVSNTVEPSPGHGVFSSIDFGNGEFEIRVVDHVVFIFRQVTRGIDRATTFERLDDVPVGLLGGLLVGGQTDLA